ncbi:hypothetical protein EDM59_19235 [Brevibacillus nitrificans]|uniref:DUF2798 domain-containing protein n=1 Tax=Brevibacillus nitrificans TaxID=651560 RepID=A0A3M8D559_9BACL|nr:hypothetical protein [Brevibacillus nitrificans]RNB83170.1 hypothetical protein EDM59_19235 [Brevibacillus nitrificans]
MLADARLPRNGKEGILFLLIISIISVNTIAPIIVGLERGFSKETYLETLKILPIMWIIAVLSVRLIAGPIVGKLLPKFVGQTDSFNARVLFTILLNVTVISLWLSMIGTWVGMREISLAPFERFLHIWPRNFGIALWIELLLAQPIARFAMKKLHERQARKAGGAIS